MRAGRVSKAEQTSFSEFRQTKSLSLEAEVNTETSSRILGAEVHVGYELDGGYAVKLGAASFHLKAKPSSAILPERCIGKEVAGGGSCSWCKAGVCPQCQAQHATKKGVMAGGGPRPAVWLWWHNRASHH